MDTIYAVSSGRPPAAVSIIRVSGPAAHSAAKAVAGSLPDPRCAAVRTLRHPRTGDVLDHALVLRFDSPASSTGEDVVELQCHGGRAVIAAVLAALDTFQDLREAQAGEFTRRAFGNGRIDLTEAEGLADLLEAETDSQRRAALLLADGALSRQIAMWSEQTLMLSAMAERAIDYDEEDSLGLDPSLGEQARDLATELRTWLQRPRAEPLKDGARVVVAGPPNAGKSSLINALSGYDRAIVTDQPGTTRDILEVALSLGGMPVVLTDTAGLRETSDQVEAIGVTRAERSIAAADILIWLGEAWSAPNHPRLVRLWAQCDRPDRQPSPKDLIAISAHTGEGLPSLVEAIQRELRGLLPADGEVALNRRQASHIGTAAAALASASRAEDVVLFAEFARQARDAFDRLVGRTGLEDMFDTLFSRFCLGK